MTALDAYRDDGPLAVAIRRRLRGATSLDPLLLGLIGAIPVALTLVLSDDVNALTFGAVALFVVLGAGTGAETPLGWLACPLLRLVEYAVVIRLTVMVDDRALPAAFALLGVLAFHHYDIVYRLRHQGVAPPRRLIAMGGGWDGRLLVVAALALAGGGVLGPGLVIAACALAGVYLGESTMSWRGYVESQRPLGRDDEDMELE